jgi:tetratricopeptide (TPR) repeat protein
LADGITRSIIDFSRAIAIKPDYLWAIERRSLAYRTVKRYAEAIGDLTRAIELKQDSYWAFLERADIYGLLGEYQQAIDDLANVLRINPGEEYARSKYNQFRVQLMRSTSERRNG